MISEKLSVSGFGSEVVREMIAEHYSSKWTYRLLLRRLQPKAVFLIDSADFGVTAAARELSIPVIELQHGFTSRFHPANSWERSAVPFKKHMALPNAIFTYGEHWRDELAANGFWDKELKVVGSSRIDEHRLKQSERSDAECTILVTTQGLDSEKLACFLADFVRAATGRLPFRLVIKLHPFYDRDPAPYFAQLSGCAEVTILSGGEGPSTFDLLRRAHLHASIYSTCHYEALALGVPTVVLPFTGEENVADLVRAGHALKVASPEMFAEYASRWKTRRLPGGVSARYFRSGALANIKEACAEMGVFLAP